MVETPINAKNAKIFSYVVCTHWLELYTYIVQNFGINVKTMQRNNENHVWGRNRVK